MCYPDGDSPPQRPARRRVPDSCLTVGVLLDVLNADQIAHTPEREAWFGDWRLQRVYVQNEHGTLRALEAVTYFDTIGLILTLR